METLKHILKKYNIQIDESTSYPIELPMGKHKCLPKLFLELGFKKGAEVGVYRATYSRTLMERIPDLTLIGVDLWQIYDGYKDFENNDILDAYNESKETYKKFGDRAILIKGQSTEIAKTVPDESLDFVFIDANHAFEYVVADIAAWAPKVRKGGIISGHDYNDYSNTRKRFDMNVVNAVVGWTKSYQIKPWFITINNKNKCWFYVK